MMRTHQQRVVLALCALALGMLLGALGGNWLGTAIVARQAGSRLDEYAERILQAGQASAEESKKVLAQLNTSPFPFCSEAEIAYFRDLVYRSRYVKEAGRIRNGALACSTTFGRDHLSQVLPRPDFSQADGGLVYRNLPAFRVGDEAVLTVQLGDSYIVYSPLSPRATDNPLMHFTVTDLDAVNHQTSRLIGGTPDLDQGILTTPGMARRKSILYATRCSNKAGICATAYMPVPEVMRTNQLELRGFVVLSGVIGALVGFFYFLAQRRKKGLQNQLLKAIRRDALGVVYQPIVDLATGRIVEAEALSRWTDEDHQAVAPDVFIKIAEQHGFVGSITRLVVRRVLLDLGSLMREEPGLRVNVNITASDLADPQFLPMLDELLEQARVPAKNLGIEITESNTARQQLAMETILRLRQRGHVVHIDDFGTGYSSLAYLHDLAVDAIKIDKTFTWAVGTDAVTVSLLPQILNMAAALKLRVIVEGIETPEQAAYFGAPNQVIYGQGWLFGRPVPIEEFRRRLREDKKGLATHEWSAPAEEQPSPVFVD